MSKYLLGWLLGVPVIVLVIIYLIFNQRIAVALSAAILLLTTVIKASVVEPMRRGNR